MSREGRRETAHGEARKAAILTAAADLLEDEGFGAVTHRAVAGRAGVSPGSVGYYFPDVDQLLVAAADALASRILSAARSLEPTGDIAGDIVQMVAGAGDPRALHTIYERYVQAAREPLLAPVVRAWTDQLVGLVAQRLEAGGGDPRAARRLVALTDGLLLSGLAGPGDPRPAAAEQLRAAL